MSAPWQMVGWLAVEVALIVAVTALIAWRMRSVVWQRTLWQASLLALMGLLVVEFAALIPEPSQKETEAVGPVMEAKAEAGEVPPLVTELPVGATELSIAPVPPLKLGPVVTEPAREVVEVKAETAEAVEAAASSSIISSAQTQPERGFPLVLAIALGVWVVGSLVLAGRLLVGRFLLLRFCARSRVVADEGLYERVQGIARKLGLKQGVRVLETERIQTPVVFGLFRLTIALPVGFGERFERRQQEAILAHELAHLAARDPLWYLLADALVSVLWWHPLVWVARARLQVTSEMAADEACVLAKHGPETLAECLVTIAKEMHGQGALESIGIEGSGFRSRLGQRVERLLKLSAEVVSRPAVWRTRLVKVGMPVVLLSLLIVGSGWMRKEGSAPWSGVVEGAWEKATGALQTAEVEIRRDPRPVLLAAATRPEGNSTQSKLDAIKVPKMVFDKLPLGEVVNMLGKTTKGLGQAVEFRLEGSIPVSSGAVEIGLLEVTAEIKEGSSLRQAMDVVCAGAGFPLLYDEVDGKILIRSKETALKVPRPYISKDGITSSPERAELIRWLNSITLPNVGFQKEPLGRVTAHLQEKIEEIKLRTGSTNRLRFILDRGFAESGLANLSITLDPPLTNRTALEVLVAVAAATPREPGKGARFTLDNHTQAGWMWNVAEPPQLYSMAFGIDVPAFVEGMEQSLGRKIEVPADMTTRERNLEEWLGASKELQDATREFFAKQGIRFGPYSTKQADKCVSLNGKHGSLFVRASMADLDVVHTEIERLKAQRVLPKVDEAKEKEASALVQEAKKLYELRWFEESEVKLREAIKINPASTNAFHYLNLIQEARYGDLAKKRDEEQRARIIEIEKMWKMQVNRGQTNLYIRIGKVDTNSFFKELERKTGEKLDLKVEGDEGHYSYASINLSRILQKYFAAAGLHCEVNGPDTGGTRLSFNPAFGIMWVRGTTEEVEIARNLVQPFLTETLPMPNPSVRTNAVLTGRQRNLVKLDQIVLKEVFFDDKPLSEVVMFLAEEAWRLDPEKKGVRFIINSNLDDLSGGLTNKTAVDLEKMIIKINPPLKNLKMIEVLDAITNATAHVGRHGLDYRVEDYAVVFRQRVIDPPQLFTRVWKVDSNALIRTLENHVGNKVVPLTTNITAAGQTNVLWGRAGTTNSIGLMDKRSAMARVFFADQGVNLKSHDGGATVPQIFFNDRTGVLMSRATLADLERIQAALEKLGLQGAGNTFEMPNSQGTTKPNGSSDSAVNRVELPDDQALKALRTQVFKIRYMVASNLQHTVQAVLTNGGSKVFVDSRANALMVNATQTELLKVEKIIRDLDTAPHLVQVEARYIEVTEDVVEKIGLRWFAGDLAPATNLQNRGYVNATIPTNENVRVDAPVLPNHISVISAGQQKELLEQFRRLAGVDVLSAPRLTTANERQAQITVGSSVDIVAGRVPGSQEDYLVSKVALGSTLDVVPRVSLDVSTIELDWVFCLTEFLGYDRPAKGADEGLPLPRFRVRQLGNSSVVKDGQTLMFGAGAVEKIEPGKKTGWFRAKPKTEKKYIIIMLTPTVVDPAGNRVNWE